MRTFTAQPGASADALRLGIEHEFQVRSTGRVVDFRSVVHGLGLGQSNLDPSDPNAYRLPSGAAVTCDGAEAEIALPPTPVETGFATAAAHRARVEREALLGRLPDGTRLEGCSTHLSVSVPEHLIKDVCRLYATTFAPALMLLMDRRESPGLLVRPRPGRVELGAEFVGGEDLAAAALFAVASVLACRDALVAGGTRLDSLELAVRVEAAVERFGWYVDRTAFGGDLYVGGRSALLRRSDGDPVSAQVHLERCWAGAAEAVAGMASTEEIALVGDLVTGTRPLPSERTPGDEESPDVWSVPLPPSPYGGALQVRVRPSFDMAPVMLTWDLAVFVLRDHRRDRRAFAAVPASHLEPFLATFDEGELDEVIAAYLGQRQRGRRLELRSQAAEPALFDALGPRVGLLAPEFDRDGQRVEPLRPRWSAALRRGQPSWLRRLTGRSRFAEGAS